MNKIVCHIRTKVNADIFKQITERLRNARKLTLLSETLTKDNTTGKSPYHFFKTLPQKATVTHFKELLQHHDALMTYGEMKPYLKDISEIKLAQFAEEARALDAAHLKAMNDKNKRYALLAGSVTL